MPLRVLDERRSKESLLKPVVGDTDIGILGVKKNENKKKKIRKERKEPP
jgi:hypothetical protein